MAALDRFGSPFPSSDAEALREWNGAAHAILAHGSGVGPALQRAQARDPDCALIEAVRGLVLLVAGRAELVPAARAHAVRAATLRTGAADEPRGAAFAGALEAWLGGSAVRAAERLDAWHAAGPGDVVAVKLAHQLRFMAGDAAGMRRAALAALETIGDDHPGRGYVLGCAAFAREELGEYRAAEHWARAAVERNADDVWAIHAVAHVHEMTGRAPAGARWIEQQRPGWLGCGNLRFHLWWHLALFEIEQGRHARALELYDEAVRAERTDDFRDVANAVSLLVRLELEGVAVGARWEELAALAAARIEDDAVVFARLHYLVALLRSGRPAAAGALVAALRRAAIRGGGDMDRVARHPGLALARALEAFQAARYEDAAALFAAAEGRLPWLGGSNAQRDLFLRFAIEAALRAQRPGLANDMIARRRASRGGALDSFAATRLLALACDADATASMPIAATASAPAAAPTIV
ncbi:MAG: tetratricopeptide repeat protein [Alphaproteobacteria bacterium]|nr:tetratricopeptide repeat protein [Alphaproteobacteria bacterium]